MDSTPEHALVTVVIAARNEAQTIVRCVHSLRQQTYPAVEIVVVDDGSTDDTAVLGAMAGATVLPGQGHGAGAARNRAAAVSRGSLIAFIDADAYAAPDWVARLAEAFAADRTLAGIGGVQLLPDDANDFQCRLQNFFDCVGFVSDYVRPGQGGVRPTVHNPSCNSSYRRAVFEAVGGFREDLFPCEDLELDRRLGIAGYRLAFAPGARVYHYRVSNLGGFRLMMRRYGAAHRQLISLHGRFRLLHWLPLVLLTIAVILCTLLAIWPITIGLTTFGALAVAMSLLVRRGGIKHLISNFRLLAEALLAWLRGYYFGGGAQPKKNSSN